MVARLKLKEIDGRAPQGVSSSYSAPNNEPPIGYRGCGSSPGYANNRMLVESTWFNRFDHCAIHLYCGKSPLGTEYFRKPERVSAQ